MVEYEIIVFTGTNSTFQLVLFSYSKPTPFNNLKFQNETSKFIFVCSSWSQFATSSLLYQLSRFQIETLEFKFLWSQIVTAKFICKTYQKILFQKHLFDIILLIIQEGLC